MKTEIEAIETVSSSTLQGAPKVSHALFLAVQQLAKWLPRTAFALVAARVLGPERFGIYALLFAMVEILAVISGSGFIDYLTREAAKDERLGWGLGKQLILLRWAYAVPFGTAAVGILRLLGYPRPVLVAAALMFLTLLPRGISESIQGVLRGIERYGLLLVVELSLGLILVVGSFLLLLHGGGLDVVIATEIMASCIAGLLGLIVGLYVGTIEQAQLSWSTLVQRTMVFNLYPVVANLYDRQDVLLLSKLAGSYATGIYSVAYRAMAMLQLVPYCVLYSLLPSLSRGRWGVNERKRWERAMGMLVSVGFAAVLGTTVFAGPAVRLVLGPSYAESAVAVKTLIWVLILRYLNYGLNIGLLAMGREKVFLVTSSVCLGVNLLGNLILIPMFSWWAAAVVTIVTELVLVAQNVYWIRQAIGEVPIPYGAVRTSLVFLALLAIALVGGASNSPLLVGAGCLLAFVGYFYRSGMTAEFALVWQATNPKAVT